jgi:hypothetical protein
MVSTPTIIDAFLAELPRSEEPGKCLGAAWRELCARRGVPCPTELVALGDALSTHSVFLGDVPLDLPDDSTLDALTADDPLLRTFAAEAPCLEPLTRMAVLGSRDGDLLLLAADGSLRTWSVAWGAPYDDVVLATSLLEFMTLQLEQPEVLESRLRPPSPSCRDVLVDGLEYCLGTGHWHRETTTGWECVTSLSGDLAPHYFRWPDGPHGPRLDGHVTRARAPFTFDFAGDPPSLRTLPVGTVTHRGQPVRLVDYAEAFVHHATAHGWTGRDGHSCTFDGWPLLK